MGEARRRGSFEERKAKAIKEKVRRVRLNSRRAGKATAYKAMLLALLAGKGVN